MWRDLFVICLVPAVVLSKTFDYDTTPSYTDSSSGHTTGGYKDDDYGGSANPYSKDDGYGGKTVCTPHFDTVFQEICESYTDRVCRTTHEERWRSPCSSPSKLPNHRTIIFKRIIFQTETYLVN